MGERANGLQRAICGLKRKLIFGAVVLIVIVSASVVGAEGTAKESGQKVVMVILNGIDIDDLDRIQTPNIDRMIAGGAIGLMNTRTGGSRNVASAYATLGTGAPVVASKLAKNAFNSDSKVEDAPAGAAYTARTGKTAPGQGLVALDIVNLRHENELEGTPAPGFLGETLHQQRLKTAVVGNADIPGEFDRTAVTIAMDFWGRVDLGNVSMDTAKRSPDNALGYVTDYDRVMQDFQKVYPLTDLVVVDTGDTTRAESVAPSVSDEILSAEREKAVQRADAFLGRLLDYLDCRKTLVMLVSPLPSEAAMAGDNYVTPVVVYGGDFDHGLLTSATTRRKGIIANTDIAPTILKFFGISAPVEMTGRNLSVVADPNPFPELVSLNQSLIFTYKARPLLVKGYVILQIVIMLLGMAVMVFQPRLLAYLRPLLLWLMAVPLSLLLIAPLTSVSLTGYAATAIAGATALVALAYVLAKGRDENLFGFLGFATAFAILIDIIFGAHLMKYSTLGYDAMAGARYYGVGNEYMGVLIGASILGISSLWERIRNGRRLFLAGAILFFAAAVFLIGAPGFGSNFGGTLAAVAAYAFTLFVLLDVRIGFKQLLIAAGGGVLILAALAGFDAGRSVEVQSHLGRTVHLIMTDGWPALREIISRKISMNLRLIRYTIWSRVFLVLLAALAMAFFRPAGLMRKVRSCHPSIFRGLLGILVGSGAALVANDSGIVAAGTMMIFGTAPLIYLISREREKEVNPPSEET